jgi:hypothetical protein
MTLSFREQEISDQWLVGFTDGTLSLHLICELESHGQQAVAESKALREQVATQWSLTTLGRVDPYMYIY